MQLSATRPTLYYELALWAIMKEEVPVVQFGFKIETHNYVEHELAQCKWIPECSIRILKQVCVGVKCFNTS